MLQTESMPDDLGAVLKEARVAMGLKEGRKLSRARVGAAAGVSHVAIQQWENGQTKPKLENLKRAAVFLGIDEKMIVSLWLGMSEDEEILPSRPVERVPSNVVMAPDAPSFRSQAGRTRDVEELGIAVGGAEGDFELNGEIVGRVQRPPALVGRDIFAVRVKSDSMEPRYREGDLLYVERKREPRPGEDVIVELHPDEEHRAGRAFIKELVSKGMGTVVVRQHNPNETITFPRTEVRALYRVVPHNEAYGV